MGRRFTRIHLLMFWSDFHKISEDPNCLTKEHHCKNNNILDDRLVIPQTLKEISQAKQTLIFLLKKLQLKPEKETQFLSLVTNSVNMTLT